MTNPFTQFLAKQLKNRNFKRFIYNWDVVETTVIGVFRGEFTPDDARQEWAAARTWLLKHYPEWRSRLKNYWQHAQVGGEITAQDPFLFLLQIEDPALFRDNWEAMQTLPAAREALNKLVLDMK